MSIILDYMSLNPKDPDYLRIRRILPRPTINSTKAANDDKRRRFLAAKAKADKQIADAKAGRNDLHIGDKIAIDGFVFEVK